MDVTLGWHIRRVFRIAVEMFFVAGILRMHGATGWTVWALSGDQRIQHVFRAQRDSIDVSFPHAGMDSIWLSESQLGVTSI